MRTSIAVLLVAAALVGCGAGASAKATTRAADGPAVLAAAIDSEQATIEDSSASAASVAKAAEAQQLAFRRLADSPSLRRTTLPRLSDARARGAALAAIRAAGALGHIVPRAHRFPHWRIVPPPDAATLLGYYRAASSRYRIPWQYLAAIELVETRMGRIHGLSSAGAQGPMQFMPATFAEYGQGSIDSQRDSIMAAARFLVANGAHRDMGDALLHYNPTRWYVRAVETYAREMRSDARAFYGYYWWQVLYKTTRGTFLLPLGYPRARPQRLPG